MKRKSVNSTVLWLITMLIISALLFPGCGLRKNAPPEPELVVIPADKQIIQLENGNYQVTPAWLQERYEYEAYITEQLENYERQCCDCHIEDD